MTCDVEGLFKEMPQSITQPHEDARTCYKLLTCAHIDCSGRKYDKIETPVIA